jgi:hypothetical protein
MEQARSSLGITGLDTLMITQVRACLMPVSRRAVATKPDTSNKTSTMPEP